MRWPSRGWRRRKTRGRSSIEVIEVFGLPTRGGSVAMLCKWRLGEELVRRAGSDPIHLASHVRRETGEIVVEGGPRSQAVSAKQEECFVVLPLSIPTAPGVYEVELDPVVEGKFWASWFEKEPRKLRVERLPDGILHWRDDKSGGESHLRWPETAPPGRFCIPHKLYGAFESERCVEIPWTLSRYRGERRVLDVGYAHAERRYTDALSALGIPILVGIDLTASLRSGVWPLVADVRWPALKACSFDQVLAISVIEHIGRDNTRYIGSVSDPTDTRGDMAAIRALAGVLRPGGRLLVTVPFGAPEDHGWFVQYDADRLDRLISMSGLIVVEAEFYRYRGAWEGPLPREALIGCHYADDAIAASGVACLELERAPVQ